jgi:hypothetical protein
MLLGLVAPRGLVLESTASKMRLPTLHFLAIISADHVLGQASSCGSHPPPLAFPITDVQVDPAVPNSLMRGVAARIGTPAQNIIVFP